MKNSFWIEVVDDLDGELFRVKYDNQVVSVFNSREEAAKFIKSGKSFDLAEAAATGGRGAGMPSSS